MKETWKLPLLLGLLYLLLVTPLMGRKMGYTVDANSSFQVTRAIVETGDLFPPVGVKQGYIYSLVYLPFYIVGHGVAGWYPGPEDGWVERKFLCWMNTVITAATVGLLAATLRSLSFSALAQVVTSLLYGVSTLAFAYARYDYNKCLAGFLLLLSFFLYTRYARTSRWTFCLGCGVATGLLAAVRAEMGIVGLAYLWGIYQTERGGEGGLKKMLAVAIPLAGGAVFVLLYNWFYWEGSVAGGYEGSFSSNPLFALIGFLFSPGKSVFYFNPVLLLLPFAIRPFWSKAGPVFSAWGGILLFLLILYSCWGNWWGGWGLGARHLVPLLPLAVLPLAALIESGNSSLRASLAGLGAVGIVIQFVCNAVDFNDVILTLEKSGITEQEMIWNPVFSPLLHHFLFLLNIPLSRWDYGWTALFLNLSVARAGILFILWLGALGGIGYGIACAVRQQSVSRR